MKVNVVDDYDNYFWTDDVMYGTSLEKTEDWGFTPVKVIPVTDGWVVLYGNSTSWNGANFMVVKLTNWVISCGPSRSVRTISSPVASR